MLVRVRKLYTSLSLPLVPSDYEFVLLLDEYDAYTDVYYAWAVLEIQVRDDGPFEPNQGKVEEV